MSRQTFTVRLYDDGVMGPNAKQLISETVAFSVNASRGAGESLVRKLGKETGERFSRIGYSRQVTTTATSYFCQEWWINESGRKVRTWVEGSL